MATMADIEASADEFRKGQNSFLSRKFDDVSATLKTLEALLADAQALAPDDVQVRLPATRSPS